MPESVPNHTRPIGIAFVLISAAATGFAKDTLLPIAQSAMPQLTALLRNNPSESLGAFAILRFFNVGIERFNADGTRTAHDIRTGNTAIL